MPGPADRLVQPDAVPPRREGGMTDRQIAILSLFVATIGAAAAVVVVPEFRCWVLNEGCSSSGAPPNLRQSPPF
jgi:hypothetical protein